MLILAYRKIETSSFPARPHVSVSGNGVLLVVYSSHVAQYLARAPYRTYRVGGDCASPAIAVSSY